MDNGGWIQNFPGMEAGKWVKDLSGGMPEPQLRFRTSLEARDEGQYIITLEGPAQRGRYWANEGSYSMTSDVKIRLYALLDWQGQFTASFRIYSMGTMRFLSKQIEKRRGGSNTSRPTFC